MAEWERTDARIGPIHFGDFDDGGAYSNPDVNVDTQSTKITHETLNGKTVVQRVGSKPDQLTIKGIVPEPGAYRLDLLTKQDTVDLVTERWTGTVIVEGTSTTELKQRDRNGLWLVKFTINAIEVNEDVKIDGIDEQVTPNPSPEAAIEGFTPEQTAGLSEDKLATLEEANNIANDPEEYSEYDGLSAVAAARQQRERVKEIVDGDDEELPPTLAEQRRARQETLDSLGDDD